MELKNKSAPGCVRIIGGQWKRSILPVANFPGLRPTSARVRETLFNWLGQNLQGWRCLDAFAGSGALGFEAASRGAQSVVMVEQNRKLFSHLQDVKRKFNADHIELVQGEAVAFMQRMAKKSFDLVMLDPPFAADLFEPALQLASTLTVSGGAVYLEANRLIAPPAGMRCYRQANAGAVHYHLFIANEQGLSTGQLNNA